MNCQILFSGKNKKNVINLLCSELAQRVVMVKKCESYTFGHNYDPLEDFRT